MGTGGNKDWQMEGDVEKNAEEQVETTRLVLYKDVKRSSNFRTVVLKFEFEFDLHTFGIRILD